MKDKKNEIQDLIIIGGGIMGLMTAYYASNFVKKIMILEKNTISNKNKDASSFSFTRSIHKDYLDPLYIMLADEAQTLWKELQRQSSEKFFIACGSLGITKNSVISNPKNSYVEKSFQAKEKINSPQEKLSKKELQKRFPQFAADLGVLDHGAGYIYQPTVYKLLLKLLKKKGVTIVENVSVQRIQENKEEVTITTKEKTIIAKKLVITAGRWVNDVLKVIKKNKLQFTITLSKPQENKYYYPAKNVMKQFFSEKFPVFAFLDIGIYGHPIFDKKRNCIKIGYYNPPDIKQAKTNINSVADFVRECMPILKDAKSEDVNDADQCFYDLVEDDNFIMGSLPKFKNIFLGAGWRGTGYKFAPLVGKILSQLALQNITTYNIARFSPERFVAK
jgi:sarcosine oxidase/L-pipecolate oxidase